MKKNKLERSDKNSHDYLNFIRRNQQIVEEFREISKIEKQYSNHPKRIASTHADPKNTLETDRYALNTPLQSQGIKRLYSKKQSCSLQDILLDPQQRSKLSTQLPIKERKINPQTDKNIEIYTRNLSIPSKIEFIKNNESANEEIPEFKFPKIKNNTPCQNLEENDESEQLEKQILAIKGNRSKKSEKYQRFIVYPSISVNNSKKSSVEIEEEEIKRAKIKSMKFTELQKTKLNHKLVRTYYDYETIANNDNIIDLSPTFKPLEPRKKEKIQILQLNNKYQNELEKFLEASAAKKYIRSVQSQKCSKARLQNQMKTIPEEIEVKSTDQPKLNTPDRRKSHNVSKKKQKQKKQPMMFRPNNCDQTIYHQKIKSYREFLFLVNFAHRIYDPLILNQNPEKYKNENKYKYYVGKGNNKMLIKSLMKRRFWWTPVDDPKQANFVWTQLKINNYYQFQRKSYLENKYDKVESEEEFNLKKNKSLKKKKFNKKSDSPQKPSGIIRGNIPEHQKKIFTKADSYYYRVMLEAAESPEKLSKFSLRLKYLPENFLQFRNQKYSQNYVHNHFIQNYHIGNKKALFYNLKRYYNLLNKDVFTIIPLTFHIKNGTTDPEYSKFLKEYKRLKSQLVKAQKINSPTKKLSKNVWIVKPGQLSNRGNGITVIDEIYELNTILKTKTKHSNGLHKTYIVQKYIEKPLLYKNRKFDIRHFMMISRLHGRLRAYWFSQGYIRTSSFQYDIEEIGDEMVHLTNDAIQKNSANYGKYEEGNKISYAEFQRYMDSTYPDKKYSFVESTYPKMREIATDSIKATYLQMDPDETEHNFQIFGLDFMIDSQLNVWLIQVNTNPCLELSSNLLNRIIPTFMENTLRMALDPIFPPTAHYINSTKYLTPDNPMDRLQFELIFDEGRDGKEIQELFKNAEELDCGQIDEDDETYENDGKEIELGGDIE